MNYIHTVHTPHPPVYKCRRRRYNIANYIYFVHFCNLLTFFFLLQKMAGNSPKKQSKPKEEEELSTGAKIGLGMAGAAAVGGAAYLLYKLFSNEEENAQMTTTPATAVQPKKFQYSGITAQIVLEEVNARIKLQQDVVTDRNVFIRNLVYRQFFTKYYILIQVL
jgi:hypothetical protein